MIKAFSPTDVRVAATDLNSFPDEVIQVVNGLLAERGRASSYITFNQDEVLERLESLFMEIGVAFSRREAFDRHWLDFEDAYRAQGWDVEFDKPGYCESYKAHWIFKPKS